MLNHHGFTLVEILTAVIIVSILTVMAMPLYEKTVERSRLAEARTIMNRLHAAKLAAMDNMDCDNYDYDESCPHLEHLRVAFKNANGTSTTGRTFRTEAFQYSLGGASDTYPNGICAKRLGGDNSGTIFAYGLNSNNEPVFNCKNADGCFSCCENYGFSSTNDLSCTFN